MSARPFRGRGYNNKRGSTRNIPSKDKPRGEFRKGIWYCGCNPPLPAERFQVKRESKNKGRWFYTCQQEEPKGCGYFMWADEGERREHEVLFSKSNSEAKSSTTTARDMRTNRQVKSWAQDSETEGDTCESTESESEQSPSRRKVQPRLSNHKRSAEMAGLDRSDEYGDDFPLDNAEAAALVSSANAVEVATPTKAKKTDGLLSPGTTATKRKLPWKPTLTETPIPAQPQLKLSRVDELLTPTKTPLKTPQPIEKDPLQEFMTPIKPSAVVIETPDRPIAVENKSPSPPIRSFNALANIDDSTSVLANDVVVELHGSHVSAEALEKIRRILARHELVASGVKRSRDENRVKRQTAEATVARLQARVSALENQLQGVQKALHAPNKAGYLRR